MHAHIHVLKKLKFLAGAKFHGVLPSEEIFVVLNLHSSKTTHVLKHHTRARCYAKTFVLLSLTAAKLKRNFAPFEINRKEPLLQFLWISRGLGYIPQGKLYINYQTLRLFQVASATVLDRSL